VLLSGDDPSVVPFLACGGRGVISVSANVVPQMMADLVAVGLAGNFSRARQLQIRLHALHRALFVESNPIPLKWALHRMGLFGPELRLPLTPLLPEHAGPLEAELKALGVVS